LPAGGIGGMGVSIGFDSIADGRGRNGGG